MFEQIFSSLSRLKKRNENELLEKRLKEPLARISREISAWRWGRENERGNSLCRLGARAAREVHKNLSVLLCNWSAAAKIFSFSSLVPIGKMGKSNFSRGSRTKSTHEIRSHWASLLIIAE